MKRAKARKKASADIMSVLSRQQVEAITDQAMRNVFQQVIATLETLAQDLEGMAKQAQDQSAAASPDSYAQGLADGWQQAYTDAAARARLGMEVARMHSGGTGL